MFDRDIAAAAVTSGRHDSLGANTALTRLGVHPRALPFAAGGLVRRQAANANRVRSGIPIADCRATLVALTGRRQFKLLFESSRPGFRLVIIDIVADHFGGSARKLVVRMHVVSVRRHVNLALIGIQVLDG